MEGSLLETYGGGSRRDVALGAKSTLPEYKGRRIRKS